MAAAFRWQIEGKLAGMGFPFEWDGELLRERGIGAIVTLTPQPIRYPWITNFNNIHLPTRDDGFGPSIGDAEKGIKFIDENIDAGRAVAVHCQVGKSRTCHMLGYYLVHHGMEPEEAFEKLRIYPVLHDDITSQMRYNIKYYKEYLDSLKSSP